MRIATVVSILFLAAGTAAMADGVLQDPEILIDSGCCSIPLSTGINTVQPTGAGTVTYDFFNDTANIVTSFRFQTMINTGLSATAAGSFTCADPGGFFLGCIPSYNSMTGNLLYTFSGVNPSDGDENGGDTEVGEQEGIPSGGHFIITLNGWTPNAMSNGETLYRNLPTLDNTFTTTPEPSSALILGGGLLLFVMLRRRTAR